jgi:hypothetical protein
MTSRIVHILAELGISANEDGSWPTDLNVIYHLAGECAALEQKLRGRLEQLERVATDNLAYIEVRHGINTVGPVQGLGSSIDTLAASLGTTRNMLDMLVGQYRVAHESK